jgi:hypothetical protein
MLCNNAARAHGGRLLNVLRRRTNQNETTLPTAHGSMEAVPATGLLHTAEWPCGTADCLLHLAVKVSLTQSEGRDPESRIGAHS